VTTARRRAAQTSIPGSNPGGASNLHLRKGKRLGIAPSGIATSSCRITWMVPDDRMKEAVRALHERFIGAAAPARAVIATLRANRTLFVARSGTGD
jgi:hypothetical protein